MTCTEGREPSGLTMVSHSRVLGDVRRSVPMKWSFDYDSLNCILFVADLCRKHS